MEGRKVVAQNRRAKRDYWIEETYEAGLALLGTEVKALREGRVSLEDGYAEIRNGEVFLVNVHISPYAYGNQFNHDPLRPRKLLLHKREIKRLLGKVKERGFTLIPLSLYFVRGKAKVELALARGKKLYDKREELKRRALEKELKRGYKRYKVH
ncbi:MAG: SsrA-binding protein [Deltaproteobacteria bacterium]|nr:MAG: SsrA-binding protein [Deltaproteobacteria bacterium]RLA96254.1 MAG: SsrA-binding protein [Deltaproteobacteria bacterium]